MGKKPRVKQLLSQIERTIQIISKSGESIAENGNADSIRISESEEVMEFKQPNSRDQNSSITMTAAPKSLQSLKKTNPDKIMDKRTSLADSLQVCERAVTQDKV